MISLKRITSADSEEYAFVEKLLTVSFPLEEYRPLKHWKDHTDTNELFNNNVVLDGNEPVGLMTIWSLDGFSYIEHFAINPELRSSGFGSNVLNILEKEIEQPIILEVEIPNNNTAKRRIEFYKRYGFKLWDDEYVQPPYRDTTAALPMKIMCRGNLDPEKDYDKVVRELYSKVYNIQ